MSTYKQKIELALKEKNPDLKDLVLASLQEDRAQALAGIMKLLLTYPGQPRLSLMSAMIEDGGVDLIPVFVAFISREGNILFAKSLVMLMAHFDHFEAVTALKDLQPSLKHEVKQAAARALGKLHIKFREQFYMDEFRACTDNHKRLKHAADAMVANPKPCYIPFLNGMLSEDTIYREYSVGALESLADESSIEPLQQLLAQIFKERLRTDPLCDFLLDPQTHGISSLMEYLESLGRLAGWEAHLPEELAAEVLAKRIKTTMGWINHSFGPYTEALGNAVQNFLVFHLLKGKIDKEKIETLALAVGADRKGRTQLLKSICGTLGRLGYEYHHKALAEDMEKIIPDDGDRDVLMMTFLAAYQTPQSKERLLNYLKSNQDPDLITAVLDALSQYDLNQVPEGLLPLVVQDKEPISTKAMALLAQCRPDEMIMAGLFHHAQERVRAATLAMIAQGGIEAGYSLLLDTLDPDLNSEYLITLIKTLAVYPRGQTGQAVYPYFLPPHASSVRQAAVQTLIKAGGSQRMELLFKGVEAYPEDRRTEAVTILLRNMEPLKSDEMPSDTLKDCRPWGMLLALKNGRLRDGALTLLARANWQKNPDESWPNFLEHLINDRKIVRSEGEKGRLRNLQERAQATLSGESKQSQCDKFRDELVILMDRVETASHLDKVCALRKLNIIYRDELIDPQDKSRLVFQMVDYFQQSEGDPAGIKLAISISAKVGDPQLMEEVGKLAKHPDKDLARFAHTAQSLALKNAGVSREIKTILVVDQALMMAKNLSKALARNGYEVAMATQGKEALGLLESQTFDLLVTGYNLGELTGIHLLKEAKLRHVAPERTIFLTSSREPELLREINKTGADGVLLKPFPMEHLYQKIKDFSFSPESMGANHKTPA